jgi:hypothetical protein
MDINDVYFRFYVGKEEAIIGKPLPANYVRYWGRQGFDNEAELSGFYDVPISAVPEIKKLQGDPYTHVEFFVHNVGSEEAWQAAFSENY